MSDFQLESGVAPRNEHENYGLINTGINDPSARSDRTKAEFQDYCHARIGLPRLLDGGFYQRSPFGMHEIYLMFPVPTP